MLKTSDKEESHAVLPCSQHTPRSFPSGRGGGRPGPAGSACFRSPDSGIWWHWVGALGQAASRRSAAGLTDPVRGPLQMAGTAPQGPSGGLWQWARSEAFLVHLNSFAMRSCKPSRGCLDSSPSERGPATPLQPVPRVQPSPVCLALGFLRGGNAVSAGYTSGLLLLTESPDWRTQAFKSHSLPMGRALADWALGPHPQF